MLDFLFEMSYIIDMDLSVVSNSHEFETQITVITNITIPNTHKLLNT